CVKRAVHIQAQSRPRPGNRHEVIGAIVQRGAACNGDVVGAEAILVELDRHDSRASHAYREEVAVRSIGPVSKYGLVRGRRLNSELDGEIIRARSKVGSGITDVRGAGRGAAAARET